MTQALQSALKKVEQLPANQQDELAAILLDELASQEKWDNSFANSQEQLSKLAREALEEFERGETLPFEQDSDLTHN